MTARIKRESLYKIRLIRYLEKRIETIIRSPGHDVSEEVRMDLLSQDLNQHLGFPPTISLKDVRFRIRKIMDELKGVKYEEKCEMDKNKVVGSTFEIVLNLTNFQQDCSLLEPNASVI